MHQITVVPFESDKSLVRTLMNNFGKILVFVCHAEWSAPSQEFLKTFSESVGFLGQHENAQFFSLAAEKCPQTLKTFGIEAVPCVLFTQTDKKVLRKIDHPELSDVFDQLALAAGEHRVEFERDKLRWHPKIAEILGSYPVILFIKGTPDQPKCGFTEELLSIFSKHKVEFVYYDIIADQYMRYWLRHYGGWPTYPQVYFQSKLFGGLNTVKEAVEKGTFLNHIPPNCLEAPVEQQFAKLLQDNPLIALTNSYSFQDPITAEFLAKTQAKQQKEVRVCNVNLNIKMKEYVEKTKGLKLPLLFVEGIVTD